MHDTDHSKEHARAAAKVGQGPETNPTDTVNVVDSFCKDIAREQGGTTGGTDVRAAVEKGRNDIDTTSDEGDDGRANPMGYR